MTETLISEIHAVEFDETNVNWVDKQPEYNHIFLRGVLNHANNLLQVRGHIFLNDVFDLLGAPRTRDGALAGWCDEKYINYSVHQRNNYFYIAFKTEGPIYDKI